MKVYVITQGSYSDYHICGVATDPEKAEKLARLYSDSYDTAEVEEFDTDEYRGWWEGRVPFRVGFYRNGEHFVRLSGDGATPRVVEAPAGLALELTVYLFAPDKDTALKIAYDKRAEYLAQKAGI